MKQKNIFAAAFLLFNTLFSYSQSSSADLYNNQKLPGRVPEVFAPGIISEEHKNSHALVFSPDGKYLMYSRYPDGTSYIISIENGNWSAPVKAPFFGKEVTFSPDGRKIYFYNESDIFYVEKTTKGWTEAKKLPLEVNSADEGEYYPCIVGNGNLYFSRNPNWDKGSIMLSEYVDGQFTTAVDLGMPINKGGASHAWISPDESYMLFNSPREGSYTRNDIWVSFRNSDKSWGEPINAGKIINSDADAVLCPTVSPDGKYLFFTRLKFGQTSNTGLLYWVSMEVIEELK